MPSPPSAPVPLPDGLQLRPIAEEEFGAFRTTTERTFGAQSRTEDEAVERAIFEPARSLAVLDGDDVVATAASYSLEVTVPGGPRPVAGVSWVGVLPTHRRRGLLSAMLRRQLDDLHEHGEAVAALWASEAGIYGRFGYGMASQHLGVRIDRTEGAMSPAAPRYDGRLRLHEVPAALDRIPALYDDVRRRRVGHLARSAAWWRSRLHDPEHRRAGFSPVLVVVAERAGRVEGYAAYRTKSRWADDFGLPDGTLDVVEVLADDGAAYAALWGYLLGVDLMGRVDARHLAVDDPLVHLLANPRVARPRLADGLWVRLVRVDDALATRVYARPVDLVLEVIDDRCPWNAGRWRLAGDDSGATCRRTTDPADLALGAADLGAAYLGGTSLATLALAGRVEERTPGALSRAATAFAADRPPWCPEVF